MLNLNEKETEILWNTIDMDQSESKQRLESALQIKETISRSHSSVEGDIDMESKENTFIISDMEESNNVQNQINADSTIQCMMDDDDESEEDSDSDHEGTDILDRIENNASHRKSQRIQSVQSVGNEVIQKRKTSHSESTQHEKYNMNLIISTVVNTPLQKQMSSGLDETGKLTVY